MTTTAGIVLSIITLLVLAIAGRATIRTNALLRYGIDYQAYIKAVESHTVGTLVGNKMREQVILMAFSGIDMLNRHEPPERWKALRSRLESVKALPRITNDHKQLQLIMFELSPDVCPDDLPKKLRMFINEWNEMADEIIRWLSFLTRRDPVHYVVKTVLVA